MDGIKIIKRPKLKNPYLIVAWPGMGEVAFKAANYVVEKLKAEKLAVLLPEEYFYLSSGVVHNGVLDIPEFPKGVFYYCKNIIQKNGNKHEKIDLVIFVSDAQPDLVKAEDYCKRILAFIKTLKVKLIFSFAAMPQPIDHTQVYNVWAAATSKELVNSVKRYNLNVLAEGQISGMNGLFLGVAKRAGLEGICILSEIPLYTIQIENPKATCAVLEVLIKIMNIELDLSSLIDQANIMESEIDKLLDYLKIGTPLGPIGEEEVEKIKKSLSQLTKLPGSVREKIEKLFIQTKSDISKAGELKSELDKWNVYKDYEDRFLDLFKNKKEGSN